MSRAPLKSSLGICLRPGHYLPQVSRILRKLRRVKDRTLIGFTVRATWNRMECAEWTNGKPLRFVDMCCWYDKIILARGLSKLMKTETSTLKNNYFENGLGNFLFLTKSGFHLLTTVKWKIYFSNLLIKSTIRNLIYLFKKIRIRIRIRKFK